MEIIQHNWITYTTQNNVTTDSSVTLARSLAAQAHVLLKNEDGILPLRDSLEVDH